MCNKNIYPTDTWYIYSLSDPRTDEIKYIGKSGTPKQRILSHIANTDSCGEKKRKWVAELKNLGLKPILNIIEECEHQFAQKRETFHIRQFTIKGCSLLNSNAQMLNLKGTTMFHIIIPNKSLYILNELSDINNSSKEEIIKKLIVDYTDSLDLTQIGSEIENFTEMMEYRTDIKQN